MKTVTIPKSEYDKLKKNAEIDQDLIAQIRASFEDVKNGRIVKWNPKQSR